MEEIQIKEGDVVHLNPIGPNMVVRSIIENNVECDWFEQRPDRTWAGPYREKFKSFTLVKVQ